MPKDIILYKRNNRFLRFLGLLFAGISIFIICIGIIDSIYNNKAIELNTYAFPIIMIVVGIWLCARGLKVFWQMKLMKESLLRLLHRII